MKLLLSVLFIYLAYRFFFERPRFLRAPGYQNQEDKFQERPKRQDVRSGRKEEDYIDYEEIE
jgi:hypothetical protein